MDEEGAVTEAEAVAEWIGSDSGSCSCNGNGRTEHSTEQDNLGQGNRVQAAATVGQRLEQSRTRRSSLFGIMEV